VPFQCVAAGRVWLRAHKVGGVHDHPLTFQTDALRVCLRLVLIPGMDVRV